MRKFSNNYILKDVNVIDTETLKINRTNVYVADGRIEKLTNSLDLSTAYQEINCRDKFLMPGLIDSQVYINSTFLNDKPNTRDLTWLQSQMKKNLKQALLSGVTTVRNMTAPVKSVLDYKLAVEKSKIPGPGIITGGQIFTSQSDYYSYISPLKSPLLFFKGQVETGFNEHMDAGQIETYIWKLIEFGVDFISIIYNSKVKNSDSVLSEEKLDLILNMSRHYNKSVSVAAEHQADLQKILKLKFSSLDSLVKDSVLSEENLIKIKEKGIFVIPSIKIIKSFINFEKYYPFLDSDDAKLKFEAEPREFLLSHSKEFLDKKKSSFEKQFLEPLEKISTIASENLKNMIHYDIPLIMGSGSGSNYSFFGDFIDELILVKEHGLSEQKIIQGSTIYPAKMLGIDAYTGTISADKDADMLLLNNNPLEDIRNLRNTEVVFKKGKAYNPREGSSFSIFDSQSS